MYIQIILESLEDGVERSVVMKSIYDSIDQLIGSAPILELKHIEEEFRTKARLFAKLEFLNPGGSIKDVTAKQMIDDAEEMGLLHKGDVIIEPTSGNTGIGLASIGAARGYKTIIVMPDTMSVERRKTIAAYGAELVLTDGKLGMRGAIEKAEELHSIISDSIIAGQFDNPSNIKAHYKVTGPFIWDKMDGAVDIFVSAVGTGGTLSGTGKYLKEKNPSIKVVAVEPASSAVLSGGAAGAHKIQGIGAGFVPKTLDVSVFDEVKTVTDEDAMKMGNLVGKKEGFLVGISSGAALSAAIKLAQCEENKGKNIVLIFPDTGLRYLSTEMYD